MYTPSKAQIASYNEPKMLVLLVIVLEDKSPDLDNTWNADQWMQCTTECSMSEILSYVCWKVDAEE